MGRHPDPEPAGLFIFTCFSPWQAGFTTAVSTSSKAAPSWVLQISLSSNRTRRRRSLSLLAVQEPVNAVDETEDGRLLHLLEHGLTKFDGVPDSNETCCENDQRNTDGTVEQSE